jgi:hypothetical protein
MDITCENCLNLKVIPKSHRIYKSLAGVTQVVRCRYNIIMSYHQYTPGAQKYRDTASECFSYNDMDDDED